MIDATTNWFDDLPGGHCLLCDGHFATEAEWNSHSHACMDAVIEHEVTEHEMQSREQAARMRAFFERNDRRIAEAEAHLTADAFTSSPRTDDELEARAIATAIMNGSDEQ
jgi:hypothetical protein